MNNNEKLSQLLSETAELLNDEPIANESIITIDDIDTDVLTEDAEAIGLIAMITLYFGVLVGLPIILERTQRKKLAKEALAISAEEYNKAIDFLMSLRKNIETIFKTSEYKKYIDKNIVHIQEDLPKLDLTDKKFNKNKAFYSLYRLFSVNLLALSKETGKYDEVIVTKDRLDGYLKKESEKLAKVIDKVKQLCNKNEFIKNNFTVVGEWNEGKTVFSCILYSGKNFVLNTSKYLKK